MIPSVQEIDNEMMKLASLRKIATGEAKPDSWLSRFGNSASLKGMSIGHSIQEHGYNHVSPAYLANEASRGGLGILHSGAAAAAHSMVTRGDPSHVLQGSVMMAALDHTPGRKLSMGEKLEHSYGQAMVSIGKWVSSHPRTALAGMLTAGAGAVGGIGYGGYRAYQHHKQAAHGTGLNSAGHPSAEFMGPAVPEHVEKEVYGWLDAVNHHISAAGRGISNFAAHHPATATGAVAGAGLAAAGGLGYAGYHHYKQSSEGDERAEALVQRALELRGQD